MSPVNLFTYYNQKENHFTNGLVSILQLSKIDDKCFVHNFFENFLSSLDVQQDIDTFKVLKQIDGTADAELSNTEICCLLETKIVSGTIRDEQLQSHLTNLRKRNQNDKTLVLLTPDDSGSQYVRQFTQRYSNILHIKWEKVYEFFQAYAESHEGFLSEIIRQYSEKIRDDIFEKDYAGVIVKIRFGEESGVYSDTYLKKMRNGKWHNWHTPSKYEKLDGTGRKLFLYDRTRQAITLEVEISEVKKTDEYKEYPWSNKFAPRTLQVYENPIAVANIEKIEGFEKYKIRSPHRNLTHEQYKQLR